MLHHPLSPFPYFKGLCVQQVVHRVELLCVGGANGVVYSWYLFVCIFVFIVIINYMINVGIQIKVNNCTIRGWFDHWGYNIYGI